MAYQYNTNLHVKIWLSNNPNVFMNLENQVRLIEMREKNPRDTIHLVFDSTLLNSTSIQTLQGFCNENNIISINAHTICDQLKSENEHKLYDFYNDELGNINTGGNLAVASDILRWLSPIFKYGTYTDFDYPIDTSNLPTTIDVDAPLLLNIGSLKLGKKEFILANNDFIAIVDEHAACKEIEKVQHGILSRLMEYDTDFIERTERALDKDGFLNRYLLKFMKNRSESVYIAKSKEIITPDNHHSSLEIRNYIYQVMTDKIKFLDFNKITPEESHQSVIRRLRTNLKTQLNLVKRLFFTKEYFSIKRNLEQNDSKFLNYLMKKERDLYLKSIVVCTTGPIEIAHALFNNYVVDVDEFSKKIEPLSFSHYGLQKAFQSQNSIPLHEHIFGMLKFLGVGDGELNDSSWLDAGKKLQELRTKHLAERQKNLAENLSFSIYTIKKDIEVELQKMTQKNDTSFFKAKNQARIAALELILTCFHQKEHEFHINEFHNILHNLHPNKRTMFTGFFIDKVQKLIEDLECLCHDAIIFSLAKDKKIKLDHVPARAKRIFH